MPPAEKGGGSEKSTGGFIEWEANLSGSSGARHGNL